MSISQRSQDILAELELGDKSQSEVARNFSVSRQWINSLKLRHGILVAKPSISKLEGWELKDTGCPDGTYPSCLKCPLEICREDNVKEIEK